jgi:hypothetical protein
VNIKEGIEKIALEKGELFIKARDKKHAESMRVTAFNLRRQMPEQIVSDVGIQIYSEGKGEDEEFFLRLFDRKIDGAEVFVRGEDGKLVPAISTELSPEAKRMINLMLADGLSDEVILENLKDEMVELVVKEIRKLKGEVKDEKE